MPTRQRSTRPVIIVLVAVLVVLILVAALVVYLNQRASSADDDPASVGPAPELSVPLESETPSTSFTRAGVAKADPLTITIAKLGINAPVELYTVAMAETSSNPLTGTPCYSDGRIACVNPPEFDRGYWLKAGEGRIPFGDQAGNDATGTTYLVGHASEVVPALFNDLYSLVAGDMITLTTANGDVDYTVQEIVVLNKSDWSSSAYANEQVPGRLVIGTCFHAEGAVIGESGSSTQNVLVVAQATSTVSILGSTVN